ncbi:MAG: hypothetical protein JXR25_04555 [Pontiellaceae bacterium]|nr:hypothetical protein [Pontiellaceae bacterium]MBN2784076.1 hypothetical protein [Pontiellaceae bacterium]
MEVNGFSADSPGLLGLIFGVSTGLRDGRENKEGLWWLFRRFRVVAAFISRNRLPMVWLRSKTNDTK